jgi:hypothetical protein
MINETIMLAAIKLDADTVAICLQPHSMHCDIIHSLVKQGCKTPIKGQQGFLTSEGRFVDREDGKSIALASGQITKTIGQNLTSEDLWK